MADDELTSGELGLLESMTGTRIGSTSLSIGGATYTLLTGPGEGAFYRNVRNLSVDLYPERFHYLFGTKTPFFQTS